MLHAAQFRPLQTTPLGRIGKHHASQRLARPSPLRQPLSGHSGRVRYLAAQEDDLVPGQGAFRTRDELVLGSFSTAQAESLTKLFPAGSALAKVFETMEKEREKEKEAMEKEREKEKEAMEKEREKEKEAKEKEKEAKEKEAKEKEEEVKKERKELKQRLDILSLVVGLGVLVLLAQHHGIAGVLNTIFKAVLRI